MYKVIVTARSFGQANDAPIKLLEEHGCEVVRVATGKPLTTEELIPHIADADAVIAGLDNYNKEVIEAGKKLKVISRYGVGYDKVDVCTARAKDIAVTITPGANEHSVADLAMALMLSAARHVTAVNADVKNGGWGRVMGGEMWQKTLGVIGLGRIGKGVVKRAKGFGMNVLCFEKYPDEAFGAEYGVTYTGIDTLIRNSDFITIHVPLLPDTKNLISDREFDVMKKTAVIVNTARGGVIDEKALYTALKEGKIAAAALDATEVEPPKGSPLLELDNCIITSHIGGFTRDAVNNMGMMAAQNAIDVLEGRECKFKV